MESNHWVVQARLFGDIDSISLDIKGKLDSIDVDGKSTKKISNIINNRLQSPNEDLRTRITAFFFFQKY